MGVLTFFCYWPLNPLTLARLLEWSAAGLGGKGPSLATYSELKALTMETAFPHYSIFSQGIPWESNSSSFTFSLTSTEPSWGMQWGASLTFPGNLLKIYLKSQNSWVEAQVWAYNWCSAQSASHFSSTTTITTFFCYYHILELLCKLVF